MNSFSDKFSFIPLEAERPKVLVAPPPAGRPLTGFTLIELLVVIGILGTLATAVVLVLNPAQLLAQARDSTRLSDLASLNQTLSLFQTDQYNRSLGTSSVVYVSVPDSSPTCLNLGLPTLPGGWSYGCAPASTLQKVDGTGWIPVPLNLISSGSPLSKLPIDPVNATSTGNYYTYTPGGSWELTALPESQKQRTAIQTKPFIQNMPGVIAYGSDFSLSPLFNSSGMVAYWNFDEGGGTTAGDASGSGHSAAVQYIKSNQSCASYFTLFQVANTWIKIHDSIQNGSVVVTDYPSHTGSYIENTDYSVDYANGQMKILSGGSMSTSKNYYVDSTCTNTGPQFVATGKIGGSISLDGADDSLMVDAASDLAVNNSTRITLMAWVKQTGAYNSDSPHMGILGHNYFNPRLYITGGIVCFELQFADQIRSSCTAASYSSNVWHHVAGVWDGQFEKVYIDGQLVVQSPDYSGYTVPTRQDVYYIGRYQSGVTQGLFNGNLDEVRVYKKALSSAEILALYNASR